MAEHDHGPGALLKLMEQYLALAYRLTLLEVHKLAYFLQEAGESLRLRYEPGHYGPCATNLNKALRILVLRDARTKP